MAQPYPVVKLETSAEPSERFRAWVRKFGVRRLGRSLGCDRTAIQQYQIGKRSPSSLAARQIIALSRLEPLDGVPLTYDEIFGPVLIAASEMRMPRKADAWE